MKKFPLVSIVIPVYNGSNYMREAIDSALAQTYKNIEIIVVNDGSNDDGKTDEIAKSYGDKIKYYVKENGGVSTALNLAIKKMKGEFFSWLSHDDLYYPNKVKLQIDYLMENNLLNEKVITYTNYDVINEDSKVTSTVHFEVYRPNEHPEYALLHGLISGTALLIPKSAFEEYGLFDESYRCIQDYLLFFNFMKTYRYIFIPVTTNATRVHSSQVTRVSPKILSENNMLWIKMQKELSKEAKIRLEGSEYKFYKEMYKYLTSNNNYTEAQKFSLDEMNKFLLSDQKKITQLLKKVDAMQLLNYIDNNYYNTEDSKKIDKYEVEIDKIINNIGIVEVLGYILSDKKNINDQALKQYRKLYNKITSLNIEKEDGSLKKIFKVFKREGFKGTFKKIKSVIVKKNTKR